MASRLPATVLGGTLAAIGVVGVVWQYGLTRSLAMGAMFGASKLPDAAGDNA